MDFPFKATWKGSIKYRLITRLPNSESKKNYWEAMQGTSNFQYKCIPNSSMHMQHANSYNHFFLLHDLKCTDLARLVIRYFETKCCFGAGKNVINSHFGRHLSKSYT
jgi:hypothetical protein